MSIAEIVDHMYVIEKREDRVIVSFLTNRIIPFVAFFFVFGLCSAAIWSAVHLGWNVNVISGLVGGSFSTVAVTGFIVAEHITRYVITIEPDVVSFQKELQGVPVGVSKTYPRSLIFDLGMDPEENRKIFGSAFRWGSLCIWAEGRSIQLETYFPIPEGLALANDLRKIGVAFPRTFEAYNEDNLAFLTPDAYFSF